MQVPADLELARLTDELVEEIVPGARGIAAWLAREAYDAEGKHLGCVEAVGLERSGLIRRVAFRGPAPTETPSGS